MARPTQKSSEDLELGYVSGVFGVRGEVRLFLHNRESNFLDRPRAVWLISPSGERREVELRARTGAGKRVLGRIDGVGDRNQAEALIGYRIRVARSALPELGDDEFYVFQVLDAEVFCDGELVGRVVKVHDSGPTTVLEIRTESRETAYVPVLPSHVTDLDLDSRTVVVAAGALALE